MQEGSKEGSNDHEDNGGILAQEMVNTLESLLEKATLQPKMVCHAQYSNYVVLNNCLEDYNFPPLAGFRQELKV